MPQVRKVSGLIEAARRDPVGKLIAPFYISEKDGIIGERFAVYDHY
jgi:hypothetical protein